MTCHSLTRLAFPALLLASLAACTPLPPHPEIAVTPPRQTTGPSAPELSRADGPDRTPQGATTPKTAAPAHAPALAPTAPPAVLALLRDAADDSASGNLDNAAATLERAIRIQPRSALLWHKLAEVRLRQQQPGLAEDLAKKSNVLGKGDAALMRKNWAIIADARRKKGDAEGAAEADAKAGR